MSTTATTGASRATSRYQTYAPMANGNGNERPSFTQRPLGATTLQNSDTWRVGALAWGSSSGSSFAHRETAAPRGVSDLDYGATDKIWREDSVLTHLTGSSAEDSYTGPSGSGALAASSEADAWIGQGQPWNNTDSTQTRNTTGNTSPNRTRDSMNRRLVNSSTAFASATQGQTQLAIGQRGGNVSSPWTSSLEMNGSNNIGQFSENGDEHQTNGFLALTMFESESSGRAFGNAGRTSQDFFANGNGPVFSRDTASAHGSSNAELLSQADHYGDLAHGGHAGNSSHSQRGSISLLPPPSTALDGLPGMGGLTDAFGRLRTSFNDSSAAPPNGTASLQTFNGASQPFQLDPGSQSWEAGSVNGTHDDHPYTNGVGNGHRSNRGGGTERGSPASSAYRQGIGSPRSFNGTPHPIPSQWPRPSSRDLRAMPDTDRRGSAHQVAPQLAALYSQPNYFDQHFNPYQSPMYPAPYNPHAARHPHNIMPYPPYGPAGYGVGTTLAPMRPSRDNDLESRQASQVLQEFRIGQKNKKEYELRDFYGHLVEFCGDQAGSRFLQRKLDTANSDEKERVFQEIEPNVPQLMRDIFGNYVIQKFFEKGNQVQKRILGQAMRRRVVDLSVDQYACRCVQKALEHVLVDQQDELVRELERHVLKVTKDQHGNHVMQKAIQFVPHRYIGFIFEALRGNVNELASHIYGCRVLQRVVENSSDEVKAIILDELKGHYTPLLTDGYGNYVCQHVMELGRPEDKERLIAALIGQIAALSKHKFASNVIEQCITKGTPEQQRLIMKEVTTEVNGVSPLRGMLTDNYGNYVVQTLVKVLVGQDKEALKEVLRPHVLWAKSNHTGRNLTTMENLWNIVNSPLPTTQGTPASTAPASPTALQVDVTSVTPTPVLTMGPNSPSSSPPSTSDSAVDEPVGTTDKGQEGSPTEVLCTPLEVRGEE